jgi:lysine 2,3-aminomutase
MQDRTTQPSGTLRTAGALVAAGLLPAADREAAEAVGERYAISVTPAMAALIDPADPADPMARQFIPDSREMLAQPGESGDPIGDRLKTPVAGLVHRYPDRVLLKVTSLCPVYCRFCFRREMVGPQSAENLGAAEIEAALAYIRERPKIWEVILTGGDPLILSPRRIGEFTAALGAIPQVKVMRWHTRVPVVAPERITDDLVAALTGTGKSVVVGLHANHPRELTDAARSALGRLARAGVMLVSQSVLLRGVNADADTLEALFRGFIEAGVKPYYLHHPDRASGTSHFRVTIAEGQALMGELRRRLSGIALPSYVLDIPGAHGKVSVEAARVSQERDAGGAWLVTDASGGVHRYEDLPA